MSYIIWLLKNLVIYRLEHGKFSVVFTLLNYWWKFICVNEYVSVKKITLIFCFSFEHIKAGKKGFWGACFMPKHVCLSDL